MQGLQELDADNLDRMVKLAMDTAEAESYEHAWQIFGRYRIGLVVGASVSNSATQQVALLTAVRLAVRVFKGGVFVTCAAGVRPATPLCTSATLLEEVIALGATVVDNVDAALPCIAIGDGALEARPGPFYVRITYDGWCCGIAPAEDGWRLPEKMEFPLAGVAGAALAVNEAFLAARGDTPMAGRRRVGMSLWDPRPEADWTGESSNGPSAMYGPSRLWLIGLGHLGQAYLWAIGALGYSSPHDVELVLQDYDNITASTRSTSILTAATWTGEKKTRAMATWAERQGFRTSIVERRLSRELKRAVDEPGLCLCGIDNALGRTFLEDVGFDYIIEAGLGSGAQDFRSLRLHTFPGRRKARDIWGRQVEARELVAHQPAYTDLVLRGLEQCGVTTLAGRAIGAPFVGTVAASLVVGEALRFINGGPTFALIDLDLKDIEHREAVLSGSSGAPVNTGFAPLNQLGERN